MTILPYLVLLPIITAAMYHLGARAKITASIHSRYPERFSNYMNCAACSGTAYGVLATLALYYGFPGWLDAGRSGPNAWWLSPLGFALIGGAAGMVLTPWVAQLQEQALMWLGGGDVPDAEPSAARPHADAYEPSPEVMRAFFEKRRPTYDQLIQWYEDGQPTIEVFAREYERIDNYANHAVEAIEKIIDKVEGPKVVCERCRGKYRPIGPRCGDKLTQGNNCCAWSREEDGRWYITGGYGSAAVDMVKLEWTRAGDEVPAPDPAHADDAASHNWRYFQPHKMDVICDACIANLFVNGQLQVVDSRSSTEEE